MAQEMDNVSQASFHLIHHPNVVVVVVVAKEVVTCHN